MSNVEPGPVDFVEGAASFAVEYSLKDDWVRSDGEKKMLANRGWLLFFFGLV